MLGAELPGHCHMKLCIAVQNAMSETERLIAADPTETLFNTEGFTRTYTSALAQACSSSITVSFASVDRHTILSSRLVARWARPHAATQRSVLFDMYHHPATSG